MTFAGKIKDSEPKA